MVRGFKGHIFITPHAKQRFIQRRINVTHKYENTNVFKKMINMIKRSELKKYLRKEDGRVHEYREFDGMIFVCERKFSKDIFKQDEVTIITVEMTKGFIKKTADKGYNIQDLALNDYALEQSINGFGYIQ